MKKMKLHTPNLTAINIDRSWEIFPNCVTEAYDENDQLRLAVDFDRFRFWAPIADFGGRYLRVITLEDKVTIHNAFPDRGFKP